MRSLIIIVASIFFAHVAVAADDVRKIDFTTIMVDQDDHQLTECADPADKECKDKRPITLGMVCMRALINPEPGLKPEDSLKRGKLALDIYKANAAQLTAEEITTIKAQIAKAYGPLVVVRVFPLLDPVTAK